MGKLLWVYRGTDDRWYIGGVKELDAKFQCAVGVLRSGTDASAHDRCLPENLQDPWEQYDENTGDGSSERPMSVAPARNKMMT